VDAVPPPGDALADHSLQDREDTTARRYQVPERQVRVQGHRDAPDEQDDPAGNMHQLPQQAGNALNQPGQAGEGRAGSSEAPHQSRRFGCHQRHLPLRTAPDEISIHARGTTLALLLHVSYIEIT
jgi:hypothetical protein